MIRFVLILGLTSACATLRDVSQMPGCPADMVEIFHHNGQAICLDRYEYSKIDPKENPSISYPLGNQSYQDCANICNRQKKRVPTHAEWLLGCKGTNPKKCNIFRRHPILRLKNNKDPWLFRGKNCKKKKNTWGDCLKDPKINRLPYSLAYNEQFHECRSEKGAVNMVGNLGEWVSDRRTKNGKVFGRFNGGLYPQPKSSCHYTTIAHEPSYRDYSIGCRCAKTVSLDDLD